MVRISDMAKETPSSSIDQQGTDSIEDEHILAQIQHMFFQHRMVLKQLDYQVMTSSERISLLAINTVSGVFFFILMLSGAGVATGIVPLTEAISFVESVFLRLGVLIMGVIGMSTVLHWIVSGVESARKIRQGPPEMPDEFDPEQFSSDSD